MINLIITVKLIAVLTAAILVFIYLASVFKDKRKRKKSDYMKDL